MMHDFFTGVLGFELRYFSLKNKHITTGVISPSRYLNIDWKQFWVMFPCLWKIFMENLTMVLGDKIEVFLPKLWNMEGKNHLTVREAQPFHFSFCEVVGIEPRAFCTLNESFASDAHAQSSERAFSGDFCTIVMCHLKPPNQRVKFYPIFKTFSPPPFFAFSSCPSSTASRNLYYPKFNHYDEMPMARYFTKKNLIAYPTVWRRQKSKIRWSHGFFVWWCTLD